MLEPDPPGGTAEGGPGAMPAPAGPAEGPGDPRKGPPEAKPP